jgi:hypothetical protein
MIAWEGIINVTSEIRAIYLTLLCILIKRLNTKIWRAETRPQRLLVVEGVGGVIGRRGTHEAISFLRRRRRRWANSLMR